MRKCIVLLATVIMTVGCMSPSERRVHRLLEQGSLCYDSAKYYIFISEQAADSSTYYIRHGDTGVAIAYYFMAKKLYTKAVSFTQQAQAYRDSLQQERHKL